MGAPLCHFEFISDNPDKCKAFYTGVFGWEFDDKSMSDYTLINTGTKPGGGLMMRPPEAPAPALSVYFMVDDIDETLEKVRQGGGCVIVPKTPIPNVGEFAMFTDPEGIVVGLFHS